MNYCIHAGGTWLPGQTHALDGDFGRLIHTGIVVGNGHTYGAWKQLQLDLQKLPAGGGEKKHQNRVESIQDAVTFLSPGRKATVATGSRRTAARGAT